MNIRALSTRLAAALLGLTFSSALSLADGFFGDPECPSDTPPCQYYVLNGSGCGSVAHGCCGYREFRCAGTSTVWRYRLIYYGDMCSNITGPYKCEDERPQDWPLENPPF